MQKKLEAELMSLAHSILKLRKNDDVKILKQKAYKVYEKLTVLAFIEDYEKETPQNTKSVEELVTSVFEKQPEVVVEEEKLTVDKENEKMEVAALEVAVEEEASESVVEDLFSKVDFTHPENELRSSLEKEFKDTVSIDDTTAIFEKAERINPKKSINEAILQQKNLQIDLNDRIAFVKNLFNNSQEDFNRVISQLNTMTTQKEALNLIRIVKREYNWDGQEIYEERLLLLIERKFS